MLLGERPVVRPVECLHIDRAGIPVILHHISRRHLHGLHLAPDIYIEADGAFQKQDLDTFALTVSLVVECSSIDFQACVAGIYYERMLRVRRDMCIDLSVDEHFTFIALET